jgi:chromosome segregation ATPase
MPPATDFERLPGVTPEMQAFARELARLVQEATCEEHRRSVREFRDHLDTRLDEMERESRRQMDRLREELKEELAEIRKEQGEQRKTLGEHGEALAEVKQRLQAGDDRFAEHTKRIERLENRTSTARERLAALGGDLARLSAAGSIGSAVAYGILKLLG